MKTTDSVTTPSQKVTRIRCHYSGKGRVIKWCEKDATYRLKSFMGWKPYCTRHTNIVMQNPFVVAKEKL